MRRIAAMIDVTDVLGLIGLAIFAIAVGMFDPRWGLATIGAALVMVAVAYARSTPPAPPAPPAA